MLFDKVRIAVFLCAFAAVAVWAQTGDADVTGVVRDPSGSPVASASVTLTNEDSGVARTVVCDADARYRFSAVPPGRYSLRVTATGFKVESLTGIVLNIGTHLEKDVPLTVGSVQEAVTVTAEVPPVDTTKGDVSGVVTNFQIDTLPINTRQYLNLALLMPGTTQDASRTFYNNVQIGGGDRFYANGFTVDGVTNTWAEQGEPRQNFPEGSVQEFKINTNQWKAEQGWAMGGVVNMVTKSGTNQFHGEAFEYWRNQALNRDNAFQKAAEQQEGIGKAPFRRNQFGGDVGGPIVKNRLHFYVAYERTQTDSSFTIFVTPSAAQYYSAVQGVFPQPSHDQMFNVRTDYQISNNQHLFGRYSQEWNLQTWQGCGGSAESNCYDGLIPRHSVVVGHTWTPSPAMVNEIRFQYAYSSYQLGPSGQPIYTDIGNFPASRLALLQPVYSFPSFRYGQGYGELGVETRWEGKDDFTLIKRSHVLKFGFDYSHVPFADDTVINYQGTWTFTTDQVFNPNDSATSANLKNPTQFTAALPPQYTSVPISQYSAYFQDDWRVHRDLTLNLGLRWDREIGSFNESLNPSSFPQTIPFLGDPSQRGKPHNFGPRFGLAWNVRGTGNNVIRAGFGIYYNNIQTLLNFPENRNFSQCNVLIKNPPYPNPYGNQSPTAFCSTAAPTVTVLDRNFANPYSQQFTVGYSRLLTRDFSIHVDGIYMHTLRDWRTVDVNYPINGLRPFPPFARILDHESISQSEYRGMYVRAEKRFARRYQFLVSYTLASARDDNPQAQVTNPASYNLDWGPAGIDRRNALVASGSVLLPWKFTLGAIWQLRSALPFSAFTSTTDVDGLAQYVPGTSRNQGNRNNGSFLSAVNAYRATLGLLAIPASQIDSSRFNSFDILVSRAFFVREQRRLELKGQVFNLFGTQNLTGGNTTSAVSSNFGRILAASNLQQAELAVRLAF
ncbi:MAG TPA: carboxypeptidase regulatory-like domain-containing protein [Candidatus Acidoferrales bacterium]|nr:carboxypeptidase regulatory-like domain-containing protein [Candidatus Acidoferrales bacterium]